MLNMPGVVEEMRRRGEQVLQHAIEDSPIRDGGPHPGRMKSSWTMETGRDGGVHKDRAYARISNPTPEAFYNEYGNIHTPRRRILGRALDSARD